MLAYNTENARATQGAALHTHFKAHATQRVVVVVAVVVVVIAKRAPRNWDIVVVVVAVVIECYYARVERKRSLAHTTTTTTQHLSETELHAWHYTTMRLCNAYAYAVHVV